MFVSERASSYHCILTVQANSTLIGNVFLTDFWNWVITVTY